MEGQGAKQDDVWYSPRFFMALKAVLEPRFWGGGFKNAGFWQK
jgi:hypothetical protein